MSEADHEKYLEVSAPKGSVSRFVLQAGPLTIGRGTDCDVRLDSTDVSRHHAELSADELGRWSIRDLESRNGTYVNGEKLPVDLEDLNWCVLEPGDRVDMSGFSMVLMISTPAMEEAMGHELTFVNEGEDHSPVSTLADAKTASIDPAALTQIGQLGMHLVQIEKPKRRLESLCRRLLRDEMHGQAVVALRLSKETPTDPPGCLCEPKYCAGWPEREPIYISRSVLRAALATNEPVLANATGAGGEAAVAMSVNPDSPAGQMTILACPLQVTSKYLDLIYIVVSKEYGTTDWLALMALAAKQFEIASAARSGKSK